MANFLGPALQLSTSRPEATSDVTPRLAERIGGSRDDHCPTAEISVACAREPCSHGDGDKRKAFNARCLLNADAAPPSHDSGRRIVVKL